MSVVGIIVMLSMSFSSIPVNTVGLD
jgi:hypothetical protein